jgi:hypothetical protein
MTSILKPETARTADLGQTWEEAAAGQLSVDTFAKDFDPSQPRDPHTGEWIGVGGGKPDRFKDQWQAIAYLQEQFPQSWLDEHGTTMDAWQSVDGYRGMNLFLRGGQEAVDKRIARIRTEEGRRYMQHAYAYYQQKIPDLDRAIADAPPFTAPLVVHRGLSAAVTRDLRPGDVLTDEGFVATAVTGEGAGAYKPSTAQTQMEIILPTGTRAAWANGGVQARNYGVGDELVLARGSRFRIISNENGVVKAVLEP